MTNANTSNLTERKLSQTSLSDQDSPSKVSAEAGGDGPASPPPVGNGGCPAEGNNESSQDNALEKDVEAWAPAAEQPEPPCRANDLTVVSTAFGKLGFGSRR